MTATSDTTTGATPKGKNHDRNQQNRITAEQGIIIVNHGFTPPTSSHEPESVYARYYWLPTLGPTAYLAWTHLNAWLPLTDDASITLSYCELAASLGTAPARLTLALQRLCSFHFAYMVPTEPSTIYLRRRAATLTPSQVERLAERCPNLAVEHDHQLHLG